MSAATLLETARRRDPATLAAATMVLFGATGDLAQRKLLPALYNLAHDALLPRSFAMIGTSRSRLSDEEFRRRAAGWIQRASRRSPDPAVLAALLSRFHFLPGPSEDPGLHTGLARRLGAIDAKGEAPATRLFYLSTVPELFSPIVRGLERRGLQRCHGAAVRLLIEKPLGHSGAEARAFEQTLRLVFGEEQVYRVDGYLGRGEVQNVVDLRFANPIFEPLWNRSAIASVQMTAAEEVGVGSRAAPYDRVGALRAHLQSHLLQLLCMICMEPPRRLAPDAVRDEKVKVLEAVRTPVAADVVRGQYRRGTIGGEPVPGYLEEEGVAAASRTETYVAVRLAVETPRWAGVPFHLRTGKRLARKETEIAIALRPAGHEVMTVPLPAASGEGVRDAHERLLLDALRGDSTLFARGDEIEQQWRICDPILRGWAESGGAPHPYPAGSQGPAEADAVLAPGASWCRI